MHKNNVKETWKLIGSLIKRKTKGQTTPSSIFRNGQSFTNQQDILDQLNQHFINAGPSLVELIDDTTVDPISYIIKSASNSFIMSLVNETSVSLPFSQLNPNKASLTIPNKLVSVAHEPLAIPFAALFNESIASGVVPEVLKISRVTLIHKSGLMSVAGNYRPISTLSPFSKVFL